jgi:glycosyltransferase involved in cell wall biosynthesis
MLAAADVGVVPIYDDSFTRYMLPVKLMEYVALGIPVICTSTSTIRAYFDDSMVRFVEAENVDDLAGAIVELHADPEKRRGLVDRAAAFNREFGWPAERAKYRALIDSLVSGSAPTAG